MSILTLQQFKRIFIQTRRSGPVYFNILTTILPTVKFSIKFLSKRDNSSLGFVVS